MQGAADLHTKVGESRGVSAFYPLFTYTGRPFVPFRRCLKTGKHHDLILQSGEDLRKVLSLVPPALLEVLGKRTFHPLRLLSASLLFHLEPTSGRDCQVGSMGGVPPPQKNPRPSQRTLNEQVFDNAILLCILISCIGMAGGREKDGRIGYPFSHRA